MNVATGFGVFDFFTVRGFDSLSSGLVLTDGVPEPESTFYPLYNVRQVEVLKGPAAFLYGGNPLSGAVQIVRKQPRPSRFAEASRSPTAASTPSRPRSTATPASADGRLALPPERRAAGQRTATATRRADVCRRQPRADLAARRGHARWR